MPIQDENFAQDVLATTKQISNHPPAQTTGLI